MIGLIVGAGKESIFAIKQAQKQGLYVVGFDGDSKAEGLKWVDEPYVVDIREPERIYRILDEKGLSKEEMVIVPSPIGRCLTTIGAINSHYNILGVRYKTSNILTDKFLFHETMKKHGLRNTECKLFSKGLHDIKVDSYPVIVKPRFGAGSRSVQIISNKSELDGFIYLSPYDEDYIIESYVDGIEYGVDGIIIQNKLYIILIRKKINTDPPFCQCVGYISIEDEQGELTNRIYGKLLAMLEIAKLKDGIIHADIIDDGKDIFVIEMSARPAGHYLYDLFTPKVTGINVIEEFLKYAMTGRVDINKKRSDGYIYILHFFDINDQIVKRIPNESKLREKYPIEDYISFVQLGKAVKIVDGKSLIGRGFFVLKGKSEKELLDNCTELVNEFI